MEGKIRTNGSLLLHFRQPCAHTTCMHITRKLEEFQNDERIHPSSHQSALQNIPKILGLGHELTVKRGEKRETGEAFISWRRWWSQRHRVKGMLLEESLLTCSLPGRSPPTRVVALRKHLVCEG